MSGMISVEEALARVLASAATPLGEERGGARSRARPRAGARCGRAAHPAALRQFGHGRLRAARRRRGQPARDADRDRRSRRGPRLRRRRRRGPGGAHLHRRAVPEGADAIVIQEDVRREGDRIALAVPRPRRKSAPGRTRFRRGRGSDSGRPPADRLATSRWLRRPITSRCRSDAARGSRSWRPATSSSRQARRSAPRRSSPRTISPSPGVVEACGGVAIDLGIAADTMARSTPRSAGARRSRPTCW